MNTAPRELNRTATPGYRALMGEIRMGDFGDPWGTALEWLFAIAGVVFVRFDDVMPGFRPSPILSVEALEDDYPDGMVLDMLDEGEITEDDLRAVYAIMNRYADWAKLAGRDY